MKPLVVLGGAVLVAGTSMAGLSTMDNPGSQVSSFMAAITGEETNKNVRRPVRSARKTPPGPIAGQNTKTIVASKPVQVPQMTAHVKASASDVATRKLVAALSGTKPAYNTAQGPGIKWRQCPRQ